MISMKPKTSTCCSKPFDHSSVQNPEDMKSCATLFDSLNTQFLLEDAYPNRSKKHLFMALGPMAISQNLLKSPKNRSINPGFCSIASQTQANPKNLTKPSSDGRSSDLSVPEKALIGAAAGAIAGAFTYFCLHPLDTIKTKLQTKGASLIYSSSFDVFVTTFNSSGIMGFYRGISAAVLGSAASSALYFGSCEFGKSALSKFPNFPPVLVPPSSGAMGNIISSAIMVPKELITQRMQVGAIGRPWEIVLRILKTDGIMGLYAGYTATLLRNLPAGMLSYSTFEYLKAAILNRTGQVHLSPLQSVCCGALAGAISAALTTPLDVVKTRLMTQVQGDIKSKIGGVSTTIAYVMKEEGLIGLTRGLGPRVLHSACFAALGYFAFETTKLVLLHHLLRMKQEETHN